MHSCRTLSCATLHSVEPMRFAGTWKTYSNNAMPQLARITIQSGLSLNFKWPYHARFMNTFEIVSRMIVLIDVPEGFSDKLGQCVALSFRDDDCAHDDES